MGFNIISAAEAASNVSHGYNIGLSGFTPGTPKKKTPGNRKKSRRRTCQKVIPFKLVFLPVLLQETPPTGSYPGSKKSIRAPYAK